MDTKRARLIRRHRAQCLANLQAGLTTLPDTLREPPRALLNVPIHRLMCAAPSIGPETCREVLQRANIWPLHSLGQLTAVEIELIIELLPERIK